MSTTRIRFRHARELIGVLALGLSLILGLTPANAADKHSSPADRERFVSITRNLEKAPLQPALQADRNWALSWLTAAPDVTVNACLDSLGGLDRRDYPYAADIVIQYMFSMAAIVIEHPETANDSNAQQLAGAEGALNAYRSILRDKPEARSSALDSLLEIRTRGELPDFVRKAFARCSNKK